jgi:hypothetical protein
MGESNQDKDGIGYQGLSKLMFHLTDNVNCGIKFFLKP